MLDEPSFGLAPKILDDIYDKIQKINQEGVTILLVEQSIASLAISHRANILDEGKIVKKGNKALFLQDDYIKKTYLSI